MAGDGEDLQGFVNDYKILVWQSRKKNIKKALRNQEGTEMVKEREDWHGL